METPLEQKRAEARKFKGVSYDARTGKFTSEIVVYGERRYLGSFDTAKEAGDAYIAVRLDAPVFRQKAETVTFEAAFSEFLETCVRVPPYNNIASGSIFTAPDGQQFRMRGVEYYRKKGSNSKRVRWMFYRWETHCRVCKEPIIVKTTVRANTVNGMTRNCIYHRGQKEIGEHVKNPMFWAERVEPVEEPVKKMTPRGAAIGTFVADKMAQGLTKEQAREAWMDFATAHPDQAHDLIQSYVVKTPAEGLV